MQESLQSGDENTFQFYISFIKVCALKAGGYQYSPPVFHMGDTKNPPDMDNYVDNVDNSSKVINISPFGAGKGGF